MYSENTMDKKSKIAVFYALLISTVITVLDVINGMLFQVFTPLSIRSTLSLFFYALLEGNFVYLILFGIVIIILTLNLISIKKEKIIFPAISFIYFFLDFLIVTIDVCRELFVNNYFDLFGLITLVFCVLRNIFMIAYFVNYRAKIGLKT